MDRSILLETRKDFTLPAYTDVAWSGLPVEISSLAMEKITQSRHAFMALLDSGEQPVIYGVTSGYGQMASRRLSPEERKAHAAKRWHASATSFGEPLPDRVVRGIIFSRLANFIEGHAAVTPELASEVAVMLASDTLPQVPALGNGTPGEIQALGWLFADLFDHWSLAEKESLALVNGSPCATALVCDAALAAERRLDLATRVFALSIEAIKAPMEAYDPVLDDLWGDPGQTDILQKIRKLTDGGSPERRSYQAPVSWRILPRVLGHAARAVAQAQDVASLSLPAITDNPVYIGPDEDHPNGRCLSTGGYHNGSAYPAMDDLAACWADLALLADRHVTKLQDGNISGLPNHLFPEGSDIMSGDVAYLGCFGMSAAGFGEQARQAAQRTFLPSSEGGGFGQNDVGVPTFLAWRKEREAGWCLEANLAILAAVASQALHVTNRHAPPALAGLVDEVRSIFPPPRSTDRMAPPMEALCNDFSARMYRP